MAIEKNVSLAPDDVPTSSQSMGAESPSEEFARLFARYHRVLFGYLTLALGSVDDAEDVLQETCVILWREHCRFVPGTNFVNWSITIAQNQVRKFRRDRKRTRVMPADELLDQLALEAIPRADLSDARRRALTECLGRLGDGDRQLVQEAYAGDLTLKALAERLGRPANTVYKALNRIRLRLLDCIERRLAVEARS